VWLAITGYVFYGYWDPRYCLLMAFTTTVSFLAGLGFLRVTSRRGRLLCLILPITVDLCMLGFFKYANFTMASLRDVAGWLGWKFDVPYLDVILPVGISFYTFHTISYIVDSYRGVIRPTKNPFEFAAYVSLFSQLVAGPIVRFRQIEADLEAIGTARPTRWLGIGVAFFVYGLFEKVVVADHLATYVDSSLAGYNTLSTAGAWLVMLGYTFQLYFDFCGYSDMAVGLGFLFGLRIPQNFNSPYQATDPADFWRRWHISLSLCMRDYIYIPLGGSRQGNSAIYRNLMITMLIGGLWHGASWTFVVWGAYHGVLLCLHRRFRDEWNRMPISLQRITTFLLVVVGWVFFRSTDFGMAATLLGTMFTRSAGSLGIDPGLGVAFLVPAALWSMAGPNAFELFANFRWRVWYGYAASAAMAWCLTILAMGRNSPFLYFQF
jgi:alginate O-acetyltransferase complex protein AlgI